MADADVQAALLRLEAAGSVRCGEHALDVWWDFSTHDVHLQARSPGAGLIRVSKNVLCDYINGLARLATDELVAEILCDVYKHPWKYRALPVGSS